MKYTTSEERTTCSCVTIDRLDMWKCARDLCGGEKTTVTTYYEITKKEDKDPN